MAHASVELTEEALDAAARVVPEGAPVTMLNLLRYREVADYGEGGGADRGPVAAGASGRTAYSEGYLPAFTELAGQLGVEVEVVHFGHVSAALVAPEAERWDDVALVRYPSFAHFRRIVESAAYAELADHHRLAALADWRLIATTPPEPPT